MRRTLFASIALVTTIACAAPAPSAPQSGSSAPTEERDSQQIIRIGATGLFTNPTPIAPGAQQYMMLPLYDSLTRMDEKFEVKPAIAEKWELSADGLVWKFTIRRDVKFSDDTPLTSEDVAFSMQEMIDKNWPPRSNFTLANGARAVDATTVEFQMAKPDFSFIPSSASLYIISKAYYQRVGIDGYVNKPLGSGPYDLAEFKAADLVRYKKRTAAHAFRQPVADEILIRAIPDNGQAVNGLRAGELDIAPVRGFSAEQAQQLRSGGMNVVVYQTGVQSGIVLQGSAETRATAIRDKRVRQAINYAINREAIARNYYRGESIPLGQFAVPGSNYYDASAPAWPYDVAKAKALLAEAGYPNGLKLDAGFDFTATQIPQDIVVAVQSDWKAAGIETAVNLVENAVFLDKAYGRNGQTQGDGFFGTTADANGFFTGTRQVQGCGKPPGLGPDKVWYCNPEWERLMDAAYGERDTAKRLDLFKQANKVQRDDTYIIFLTSSPAYLVTGTKLKGLAVPNPYAYNVDSAYKVK